MSEEESAVAAEGATPPETETQPEAESQIEGNFDHPMLSTGEIVFRVQREEGYVDHKIDILTLKLTCEECEKAHSIEAVNDRLQPTAAFLVDLAGRLEEMGVCGCTPTIAWQMWISASDAMTKLKNSTGGMLS